LKQGRKVEEDFMLKIAVLDDQDEYVKQIRELTAQSMQNLGVRYRFKKYSQASQVLSDLLEKEYYDIYLLDVEMPDMSGLEVARLIRKECWGPVIIYITNHVEYAVEAFEVNAYRYIPKSMLEEKLPAAFAALAAQMDQEEDEYYKVERGYQFERIPYQEIYYLKKEEKYVLIVHKRGQSRVRKTLSEMLEELGESDYFIKIDRSYVVNVLHIMSLKNQQILLRDGSRLPVGKPRLQEVKQRILEYWR
jgi:DNA-binding LytR/AlgR family response regulator